MSTQTHLRYSIAGFNLGLVIEPGWEFAPLRGFPIFSSSASPNYLYHARIAPKPRPPDGPLVFDSGQSWRLFANGSQQQLWVGTRHFEPILVGTFNQDFLSGEIFTTPHRSEPGKLNFPFCHPLGELLMTSILGLEKGIMLHSCGVIDAGDGLVFAGISTAGKTTTARLWNQVPAARVINDDHTILRKVDGEFRVYGTPWHGEGGFALPEDAPLKKICILKHAPTNQAVHLSPSRAAAALMVRTFPPLWSSEGMAFTLQFLDDLCHAVPCYELGFVPDRSVVEYVRCLSTD